MSDDLNSILKWMWCIMSLCNLMIKIESQLTHKSKVPKQTKNPIYTHLHTLHTLNTSPISSPTIPCSSAQPYPIVPHPHTHIIKNMQQQSQLMQHILWRQNTKSSIVNIIGFSCQCSDYGYPKIYRYEVEPIRCRMGEMRELELGDLMYVLRGCVEGVGELINRFGMVNIEEIQYFVNVKNQCKVWISNNLYELKPKNALINNTASILISVISKICQFTKMSIKQQVNQLKHQIFNNTSNLTFERTLQIIQNFVKNKNMYIGQCLGSNYIVNFTESHILPNTQDKDKDKEKKPITVNFRYYSPSSRHLSQPFTQPQYYAQDSRDPTKSWLTNNTRHKSSNSASNSKQFWRYHNESDSQNSSSTATMSHIEYNENNNLLKVSSQSNQFGLRSQYALKNKLKASKNSGESTLSPIRPMFQNFSMSNIQNKACVHQQYPKDTQVDSKKQRTKAGSRLTGSQPILMSPTRQKPEISHFILNHKSQLAPQTLIESPKKRSPQNRHQSKSTAPTSTTLPSSLYGNQDDGNLLNLMCSENNFRNWNFKIKCLISDNSQDLKQSMHCGQDVRKQSGRKLEKLGKMGRVITSVIEGQAQF